MPHSIEHTLDTLLGTGAPYHLSQKNRDSLVQFIPWITLVSGIMSLLAAYALYAVATLVDQAALSADFFQGQRLSQSYTMLFTAPASWTIWLNLGLLVVEGVLFLLAFMPLKARQKKGWNVLCVATLLAIATSVAQLFEAQSLALTILSVLVSIFGLYLLFQIRPAYRLRAKDSSSASGKNA